MYYELTYEEIDWHGGACLQSQHVGSWDRRITNLRIAWTLQWGHAEKQVAVEEGCAKINVFKMGSAHFCLLLEALRGPC